MVGPLDWSIQGATEKSPGLEHPGSVAGGLDYALCSKNLFQRANRRAPKSCHLKRQLSN